MRTSKLELIYRQALKELLPNQEVGYNVRFNWLKNKEIDIFYPKLKLAIEVNGPVHKDYEIRKNDLLKKQICSSEGIKLISVSSPKEVFRIRNYLKSDIKFSKELLYDVYNYKASKTAFKGLQKFMYGRKHRERLAEAKEAQLKEHSVYNLVVNS